MWFSREVRGPLWAMASSWLICIAPIATGALSFSYFDDSDLSFALVVIAYLSCFAAGCITYYSLSGGAGRFHISEQLIAEHFRSTLPVAILCAWVGMIGTICLLVDFLVVMGPYVADLADLRETYVNRRASGFAQIASVLTWGCLYSFIFGLTYRNRLTVGLFLKLISPIAGYFLLSVLSAGRQAALQIMMFAILVALLDSARKITNEKRPAPIRIGGFSISRNAIFAIFASVLMVSYMGYIAEARDDALISDDRVDVLSRLFEFSIAPPLEAFLNVLGTAVRTTAMEAMVYFSSSIALFSKFLTIDFERHTYGAMTFPFLFRQIEPLTGISVIDTLNNKIDLLGSTGVIGQGWTTGVSSYIMDFGKVGAGVFLFVIGYYSAYAWRRAVKGLNFNERVIGLVMIASAVYMPFQVGSSDTNLLLLWLFCFLVSGRRATNSRIVTRRQ
jgi:oligosaccharide repeat unit polymerase